MRRLALTKSIESAEQKAKEEGKSLRQWMDENRYEFNDGNTHIDKYVEIEKEIDTI